MLSRVTEVAQRTKGRQRPLDVPEGGWTWPCMAELPAGGYMITLVPDEVERSTEEEMPAEPVINILARSAGAWDRHVQSLLATVEKQQKLIGELYAQIAKLQQQDQPADPASQLGTILGVIKGLLPAAPAQHALPTATGNGQ